MNRNLVRSIYMYGGFCIKVSTKAEWKGSDTGSAHWAASSTFNVCLLDALNATFNNNSVISWQLVLLVEETGRPGENHRPAASHWQTLSHNVVSSTPHPSGIGLAALVVIATDCIGSWKSNYHTITATTAQEAKWESVSPIMTKTSIISLIC